MLDVLVAVLPFALGALVASLPVVAMAAVIATLNFRPVLRSFTAGWLAGLLTTGVLALVLTGAVTLATDSVAWASWLRVVLGAALVALGVRRFVTRARRGEERTEPKWVPVMQNIRPGRAFGVAFLLGSINPKNALIVLAAVAAIVNASSAVVEQFVGLFVFVVVASLGVVAPAVALRMRGDRAAAPLHSFVDWFARHSDLIIAAVLLLLGLLVLSAGLGALL
ncbi:GAP family protein [Cryobacterium sp. CG_9.6]|uniref:GAP family protein n=1 Tax=Cryobacterium sp. CG_9.6 TaxID=2760710 RepID=UPI0024758E9C|nr:GAP family protein [Cryobacterium sp. CG_9.6]MDH6238075.1 threonine/homoserine/homoserine lactone efflux protein [Cryobacterium sp. CG_9.6]